jgi:superfamily II DNA or RNA helicase
VAKLEEIKRDSRLRGVVAGDEIVVIDVAWHGKDVVELTYKDPAGRVGNELLFRDREPTLEVVQAGRRWTFRADSSSLRLVSEARRIRLAHLFDPHLAVHTSLVDPLPHQITAVYGEMLSRQPLRFLLADDPGAGKTVMAGLFIKELMIRGDVRRCLIICPGNLVEQWQDELYSRFQLPFDILTNDRLESARSGNVFTEVPFLIARLDKLARDDDARAKLAKTEWDLIVCDEAHKMSASFFSGEVKETKRYKLGRLLSTISRHFLLLTATPHNGKEEDYQLFMSLIDPDRFEGRFREGTPPVDASDIMRRMVKEQLLKFDGTPLFPERFAHTLAYPLSPPEKALYDAVTDYVRDEFNRADKLESEGRRGTVGFALTVLQRRLASSPEAIYQSLRRRRERLEERLRNEEQSRTRGRPVLATNGDIPEYDLDDLDEAPGSEAEAAEESVVDQATAARTLEELRLEIATLARLEGDAGTVKRSAMDRKWEELSKLLQSEQEMFDVHGQRRKLIVFTEHRDTLNYLAGRIRSLLGRVEAVVTLHGGMHRQERKSAQDRFTQDKDVLVMVATDAAGEGINLQRAHLMVNYDLPWNPNRIEQRFGRIHRIGQTEACYLWNLVAHETREGEVYATLLRKLQAEHETLKGAVFDVLGKAIDGLELRALLIEAIRKGDRPEVRDELHRRVEALLDHDRLQALLEERALTHETLDAVRVLKIREEMERIEARRLQPHFIATFFVEAFRLLGGTLREREPKRYEITHVPAAIRAHSRLSSWREAVLDRYERICFDKGQIHLAGKAVAEFVCPGHPLLEAVTDIVLERYRDCLERGAVLVDDSDPGESPRVLVYLEHAVQDGRADAGGNRRVVSRRLEFVELDELGGAFGAGPAPYLDYRAPREEERDYISGLLETPWLQGDLDRMALSFAITNLVPDHFKEVKERKEKLIAKTVEAVKDRLTREIHYWDRRAEDLKAQERQGKVNARINSAKARARADELEARLQRRMRELEEERQLSPLTPLVAGCALVIPAGWLARVKGARTERPEEYAREKDRVESIAMSAVVAAERELGYEPRDVSSENRGYDVESRVPQSGKLRFIEVKGRIEAANAVTVTRNEILTAFNKPDDFILALVRVPESDFSDGDVWKVSDQRTQYGNHIGCTVHYVRRPFQREPDFGVTSVTYNLAELIKRAEAPS